MKLPAVITELGDRCIDIREISLPGHPKWQFRDMGIDAWCAAALWRNLSEGFIKDRTRRLSSSPAWMTGFLGAGRALEEIFYADTGNLMHNYAGWDTLNGRKKEALDAIDWENNPRGYWRMSSRAVRMDLFKDEWMKDPWGMDRFAELMPGLI